jgi:hypothetical protein
MNSGIVSGTSVSATADLTNFKTQLAFGLALTRSDLLRIKNKGVHDFETQDSVLGQIL